MNYPNPINPVMLRWARETAGLSVEQVVSKLARKRITGETVLAWESGELAPNYLQLERLAYQVYKRPLAIFFFPEPPSEETPRQAFRTLPDSEIDRLTQRLRFLLRQAKSMQLNLDELYGGVNPAGRQLVRDLPFAETTSVSILAGSVREFIGVNLSKQLEWSSNEEAFKAWREALETIGVFVFKDAFRQESISGFCLHDTRFPIIYVNNSRPHTHQIFTLFHELAHLLSGTGGIDTPDQEYIAHLQGRDKAIEMLCSQFAAAFLVPKDDFESQIVQTDIDEDSVGVLANRYKVSREVILRRLKDKGLVTPEYYGQMVAKWRSSQPSKTGRGGNYYYTQGAYLGDRYLELVFSRFYQNRISLDQVAEYLRVKVSSVPGMEALLFPESPAI